MPFLIGAMLAVALWFILRTTMSAPTGMTSPNYWLMLIGCILVGVAVGLALDTYGRA